MEQRSCDSCEFGDFGQAGAIFGLCRKNAPGRFSGWARVAPDDWCGQWRSDDDSDGLFMGLPDIGTGRNRAENA